MISTLSLSKILQLSFIPVLFFAALNSSLTVLANYGDFGTGGISSLPTNLSSSSNSSQNSNSTSSISSSSISNNAQNANNLQISIDDPYTCGGGTMGSVKGGTGKRIVTVELFNGSRLIYTVSTVVEGDKWKVDFDYSRIPSGKYLIISTVKDEKGLSANYQFTADVKSKAECTPLVQLSNQVNTVLIRTGGFVQNNLSISLMSAISLIGFVIFFKSFGKKRSFYR